MKRKILVAGCLILYGAAVYNSVRDTDRFQTLNDIANAMTSIITSIGTASASYVDLTPHTVVDKNFFNLDADQTINENQKALFYLKDDNSHYL